MTIQVDLEKLRAMSKSLHALSGEAAELDAIEGVPMRLLVPFGREGSILSSVVEASRMAVGVQSGLVPAVSARLREIGELMHAVTVQFRQAEESSVVALAATYTKSSGAWGTPK
ncbi:hypothetical protein [Nocardia sp. NPDC057030]|uniref:hypothetical protein n=1 Tax=unclassified Nocardia TaxID=2637762 RepID=UPI003645AC37